MDLRYVLLNVHSRLSPGLQSIHWAGTAAPARVRAPPPQQKSQACNLCYHLYCIPFAGLWTHSTHTPHPDTWEEDKGGRNEGEADG